MPRVQRPAGQRRHPGGRPAGLTPPAPSHAERSRTLVASANRGTLCTLSVDPSGYPFGSLALYAPDDLGRPLFLLSRLAEHTRNFEQDRRASLLVAEPVPEGADPLAGGRVTLLGRMSDVDDREAQERYLAANPSAAAYLALGDFAFYRLDVEHVRYVGGYGRMGWVGSGEYAAAEADPLAPLAAAILGHMNGDHADAQVLCCRHLAGRPQTTRATMVAVDRYGFEMVAENDEGQDVVRLGFPWPCSTRDDVRRAMVAMVADARRRAG